MSVRCPDCGAMAGYGYEIGHKTDCPSLRRSKDREREISRMRDLDVERGRLESWTGGRVKPLISERDE